MWLWALLGWLAVSGAAALLHHRWRSGQPQLGPELAAFVLRFETILAERHPEVRFAGLLPDQFACLLEVDGQETPVALDDAYRHEHAFPDALPDYVARLVAEIRDVGLDRLDDVDLAFASPLLLPQVRSRAWLEQKGVFGDSGLVHRALNDDLVVVYVIDDAHAMVFLSRAHLQRWRKSETDIHNLALANLARLDPAERDRLRAVAAPLRVAVGDGYDAARVLLLEATDGLLVSVPDRDLLWVGGEADADLVGLMADAREIAARAPHPVSARVYRLSDGLLEAVPDEPR
jgi:hypothetical protein